MDRRAFLLACASTALAGCAATATGDDPAREPYDLPSDWDAVGTTTPIPEQLEPATPTATPTVEVRASYGVGEYHRTAGLDATVEGLRFLERYYPLYTTKPVELPADGRLAAVAVSLRNDAAERIELERPRWAMRLGTRVSPWLPCLPVPDDDSCILPGETVTGHGRTYVRPGLAIEGGRTVDAWFASVVPAAVSAQGFAVVYAPRRARNYTVAWPVTDTADQDQDQNDGD